MASTAQVRITAKADASDIAADIEPKMRRLGQVVAGCARRLVPKRTFALHDSIRDETRRDGKVVRTRVIAGNARVGYAVYVERGTSRMVPQPYLRPALLQSRAADLGGA